MNEKAIDNMVRLHEEAFGNRFIQPVSREDMKLVSSLVLLLDKSGLNSVSRIMDKYKTIADKDINLQVSKVLSSINNDVKQDVLTGNKKRKRVIEFNDISFTRVLSENIYSWSKTIDEYGNASLLLNEGDLDVTRILHEEAFGNRFIQPVSREDMKLVSSLVLLLDKSGLNSVSRIMDKYKTIADKDINLQVSKVLSSINNDVKQDVLTGNKKRKRVIEFNDISFTRVLSENIYSWSKTIDEYGNASLLLNEGDLDVTRIPVIYNKLLFYDDEVKRDDDFEMITIIKNG